MKLDLRSSSPTTGSFVAAGLFSTNRAPGLVRSEWGTPDVVLASAGGEARANDACTVFKNRSAMSRIEGSPIQAGGKILAGKVSFTRNVQTTILGNLQPHLP